jgi:hypothetical protein
MYSLVIRTDVMVVIRAKYSELLSHLACCHLLRIVRWSINTHFYIHYVITVAKARCGNPQSGWMKLLLELDIVQPGRCSAFLWNQPPAPSRWITVDGYRCFWETCTSWTACLMKMGRIGCPETSVTNYQSTLCTIPEGRSSFTPRLNPEISTCTLH